MTRFGTPITSRGLWPSTVVTTAAMATSMIALYAVSGLGPALVTDLGLSRAELGGLVTATFGVAAAASLVSGHLADVVGARRGLLILFAVVSAALIGASRAGSYGWLLAALAVAGVGQALANPATNLLIVGSVPPRRRGLVVGIKQSGVQLAAVAGGALLPLVAGALGWRAALAWTVVVPVLSAALVLLMFPAQQRQPVPGSWWRWSRPSPWLLRLMGYSMLLGTGLAAVNTYLPLYAAQQLGFEDRAAGFVLAVFGVSGLVARVWWSRWADRLPDVTRVLVWLSVGAGVAVLALGAAQSAPGLVWLGAFGVGATATGPTRCPCWRWFVGVVRRGMRPVWCRWASSAGSWWDRRHSGTIADQDGYPLAWCAVVVVFVGSAVAAVAVSRSVARAAVTG